LIIGGGKRKNVRMLRLTHKGMKMLNKTNITRPTSGFFICVLVIAIGGFSTERITPRNRDRLLSDAIASNNYAMIDSIFRIGHYIESGIDGKHIDDDGRNIFFKLPRIDQLSRDEYIKLAQIIKKKGGNPNKKDKSGITPLLYHCMLDYGFGLNPAEILLEAFPEIEINNSDSIGNNELHHANYRGNKSLVELLIKKGGNPAAQNAKGYYPFEIYSYSLSAVMKSAIAFGQDTYFPVDYGNNNPAWQDPFNDTLVTYESMFGYSFSVPLGWEHKRFLFDDRKGIHLQHFYGKDCKIILQHIYKFGPEAYTSIDALNSDIRRQLKSENDFKENGQKVIKVDGVKSVLHAYTFAFNDQPVHDLAFTLNLNSDFYIYVVFRNYGDVNSKFDRTINTVLKSFKIQSKELWFKKNPQPAEIVIKDKENLIIERSHIVQKSDGSPVYHGLYTSYYPNGAIHIQKEMYHNLPHGRYVEFYENNQKKETGEYRMGRKIGSWHEFDQNGKLRHKENY